MPIEQLGRPTIRNEERSSGTREPIGFEDDLLDDQPVRAKVAADHISAALLRQLTEERRTILNDPKLSTRERLRLLESNRETIVLASGGSIKKTENVVYSILIFGAAVIIILALLTVFGGLPSEVTLTFVGTVLGGTIATIAQKLGKI